MPNRPPRILIIAGSDSSGGAGIQADLKTVTALGGWGMTAITALTAQNTRGVNGIVGIDPEFVVAQIEACLSDLGADAIKTGMLYSAPIIRAVAKEIRRHRIGHIVIDPVMVATSGAALLERDALEALRRDLLPLATLVTPNLSEAGQLLGRLPPDTTAAMGDAARAIADFGPPAVLVKGGHLTDTAVDVLFDGSALHELPGERIETHNTHGTGCILASALATKLAAGLPLINAADEAKRFVTQAIRGSLDLGAGPGPANPVS